MLLLIFAVLLSSPSDAQKRKVSDYYDKALVAFNNNQVSESISHADSALMLDEWNQDVLYLRANAYELKGEIAKAIIDYEKITMEDPGYLEAFLAKAILYYKQKNYEGAMKNIQKIENYDGFVETKAVLFKSRSFGEGGGSSQISGVTSVQSLKNDMDYYKGLIYRDSGELIKARELFKRLISKSNQSDHIVALGLVYQKLNKVDSAKIAYRKALKVDPTNNSAAYQLQLLDPSFEPPTNLNDEEFHYALAKKAFDFYEKGNYLKALTYYGKAIKIAPDVSDYYASRGLVHEKLMNYDQAIGDFRNALYHDSNFIVNYYRIANVHYKQKKFEEAIAEYTIYLSYVPDDADILYNLGLANLNLKKKTEACDALIRAKKVGNVKASELILKYCNK